MECIRISGIAGKFLEVSEKTIIITMTDKEFNKDHHVVSLYPLKRCIRVFQIHNLWLNLGEIMLDKHSHEVIFLMWIQFI